MAGWGFFITGAEFSGRVQVPWAMVQVVHCTTLGAPGRGTSHHWSGSSGSPAWPAAPCRTVRLSQQLVGGLSLSLRLLMSRFLECSTFLCVCVCMRARARARTHAHWKALLVSSVKPSSLGSSWSICSHESQPGSMVHTVIPGNCNTEAGGC